MILENARGFVYCVSQMGVTGKGANFHKDIIEYLSAVKNVSKIPVMVGFGIRTPKDIEPFEDIVDGAIVGSNLLRVLEESNYSVEAVEKYVSEFKQELNR
jgi:tryptophan synthase alpha chain